jgi:hypothetical protein
MNTNTQNYRTFHLAYRAQRALGMGKIQALAVAKKQHWPLYVAYCKGQETGEAWTREPLDEKDEARRLQIISTGRLI